MCMSEANYDNDSRVIAGRRGDWFYSLDLKTMTAEVMVENPDPNIDLYEIPVVVRVKYAVCGTCGGRGTHVDPSIDCNGLGRDDFDDDPDFREDYFSGRYDVECYGCQGQRVVIVMDREKTAKDIIKLVDSKFDADAAYEAEIRAERRMGC